MGSIYKILGMLRSTLLNYLKKVDDNFTWYISTDVVGVIASIFVLITFIPIIVVVLLVSMVASFFKTDTSGKTPSSR
jgi:hypothetical protein